MAYSPPGGGSVILDLIEGPDYSSPPGDDVSLNLGAPVGLQTDVTWDLGAEAFRLEISWPEAEGATGYLLALYQGEDLLEEIDTAGLDHAFTGLDAETTFLLVLTPYDAEGDLEVEELEVETPMGLPGAVSNLQHSFTTDSLTYTWDEVEGADDYLLTLFRDGEQVDEQAASSLTATFSGLEDGIRYTLEIRGRRGPGEGESVFYEADTGFLAPATPINFHEVSRRIIAVEPGWELAEPDKVREVRIQVLLGDEILYDEVKDEAATSRLFPVPMASTDYFVRVRAGNPGGWSDWLQGTASTLVYPLLDTRLGVIGAAYQEAMLRPDTWNLGADVPDLARREDSIGARVKIESSASSFLYDPGSKDAINLSHLSVSDFLFTKEQKQREIAEQDAMAFSLTSFNWVMSPDSTDLESVDEDSMSLATDIERFEIVPIPVFYAVEADSFGVGIVEVDFSIAKE